MKKKTKTIYIMFSYTGTILSRIVKICTKKEYSHVSIALDLEFDSLYSFGRINPRNPFTGGFVKEEIDNGTYKIFKNTICAVYSLQVTQIQYDDLKKVIDFFNIDKDQYKFNVVGLIGAMVNKPFNREYHYFCSQFVSKALLDSNIYDFKKDIGLIKPIDFYKIPNLNEVFIGKLSEYPATFKKNSIHKLA